MTNRAILFVLAALLSCTLIASAAFAAGSKSVDTPKDAADTEFNEGVELLERGKYDKAAKHFRKALDAKEDFAEAHNNLAYSLRKQGAEHYDEAKDHYDRAIALDPNLAQAYHYRGVLHALAGDEASAKDDHAMLLELDRDLADELMQVIASGEEPSGDGGVASWD